jgi:hypothetical protein
MRRIMTRIQDDTEKLRRHRLAEINSAVESNDLTTERTRLEVLHGKVWNSAELFASFEVIGFAAPYVVVRRRADGNRGSMEFQHHPRFYFNLILD